MEGEKETELSVLEFCVIGPNSSRGKTIGDESAVPALSGAASISVQARSINRPHVPEDSAGCNSPRW